MHRCHWPQPKIVIQKTVPDEMNGIRAKTPSTPLEKSVLEWSKTERLHKYWPVFSNMRYDQLVNMREENLDSLLRQIGALPITTGARKRILKCAELLRCRATLIKTINAKDMYATEVAERFLTVLRTPICQNYLEPDGENLARLMRDKLHHAIAWYGDMALQYYRYRMMLEFYSKNECLPQEDRATAARALARQKPHSRPRHDSCPSSFASNSRQGSPKSKTSDDENGAKAELPPTTTAFFDSLLVDDNVFETPERGPAPKPPGFPAPTGVSAPPSFSTPTSRRTPPGISSPTEFSACRSLRAPQGFSALSGPPPDYSTVMALPTVKRPPPPPDNSEVMALSTVRRPPPPLDYSAVMALDTVRRPPPPLDNSGVMALATVRRPPPPLDNSEVMALPTVKRPPPPPDNSEVMTLSTVRRPPPPLDNSGVMALATVRRPPPPLDNSEVMALPTVKRPPPPLDYSAIMALTTVRRPPPPPDYSAIMALTTVRRPPPPPDYSALAKPPTKHQTETPRKLTYAQTARVGLASAKRQPPSAPYQRPRQSPPRQPDAAAAERLASAIYGPLGETPHSYAPLQPAEFLHMPRLISGIHWDQIWNQIDLFADFRRLQ
ncbi:Hypothetical protein NTJ_00611 [Nesidiocoris tenuis]|uniref:SAM domain-containing protein n=1 Tax=Nesidiocoris tenuis TaxID=355587 RepID=A0ABN7A6E9_9HEMI|nr:Hypothetical protein NTJ_00611 [Nesidiocoris tenuis]